MPLPHEDLGLGRIKRSIGMAKEFAKHNAIINDFELNAFWAMLGLRVEDVVGLWL